MKKRIWSLTMALMMSVALLAQKQVTKFMGIPVDGFKKEMIQKLESKGFEYHPEDKVLTGEFNGKDVIISIVTTNNKVSRILVRDAVPCNEAEIKIRFNQLCRQFENNERYVALTDEDQTIPDDELISFEMLVHKKHYEGVFYQDLDYSLIDTLELKNEVLTELFEEFTKEEVYKDKARYNEIAADMSEDKLVEMISNRSVWFTIHESRGRYSILLFYDNEYNRAHGEDL